MELIWNLSFENLKHEKRFSINSDGAYVELEECKDTFGNPLNIVWINNGRLKFSLIIERGMDVADIFFDEKKYSWERNPQKRLSPKSVNLRKNGGWEEGFYSAVTTLGPQLFGTPDKVRSVHGTGAYSPFDYQSIEINYKTGEIKVFGAGITKGFRKEIEYKKYVTITTKINSAVFIREEATENLTDKTIHIDDGYHIQMNGEFMKEGGEYVLPTSNARMLLRDSVPKEENPKEIYASNVELNPIRCYQYVPEKVTGLETMDDFDQYSLIHEHSANMTCEMLVNKAGNEAVLIARPLDGFPRSLLAKRNIPGDDPMYALEVCKTRPNSIVQKAIDGELMYIEPGEKNYTALIMGIMKKEDQIQKMRSLIESRIIE